MNGLDILSTIALSNDKSLRSWAPALEAIPDGVAAYTDANNTFESKKPSPNQTGNAARNSASKRQQRNPLLPTLPSMLEILPEFSTASEVSSQSMSISSLVHGQENPANSYSANVSANANATLQSSINPLCDAHLFVTSRVSTDWSPHIFTEATPDSLKFLNPCRVPLHQAQRILGTQTNFLPIHSNPASTAYPIACNNNNTRSSSLSLSSLNPVYVSPVADHTVLSTTSSSSSRSSSIGDLHRNSHPSCINFVPGGKYSCKICAKSFRRKHHYESHMVTHSSDYRFICKLPGCKSKFRRNQDLLRHLRNVKHFGV